MTDLTYLDLNPPARSQFRRLRSVPQWANQRTITAIVVHTAENMLDTIGPDNGAENVANFIAKRTDAAGSYHSIVDSDSVIQLGRYEWEMFHEGTGGNRWSLGLAFACSAGDWPIHGDIRDPLIEAMLKNGADEANRMRRWVKTEHGIDIPARWIAPAAYRNGERGFVGHGHLDPDRRSDPGASFPWNRWLEMVADRADLDTTETTGPVTDWQRLLVNAGHDIGTTGPNSDGVDNDFGQKTLAASIEVLRTARTAGIALDDAALGALTREVLELHERQKDSDDS